jgi:hypothetical protein
VWKFHEIDIKEHKRRRGSLVLSRNSKRVNDTADLSLFSFLKVIAKINKLRTLCAYRRDKALNDRMDGYRVKLGFGLHVGWSIEGAIGSEFKIDASYLSANVHIASVLEGMTK